MPKQDADYSAGGGGSGGCARWAHFRFSVIGPLLAAPPGRGDLQAEIALLAGKQWRHPVTGQWVRFGSSTIERWYYRALHGAKDPVGVLTRKVRNDHGAHRSLSFELRNAISVQHQQHPEWSCQLHYDNLAVRVAEDSRLGALPSYVSVRRYMRAAGMFKRRRLGGRRDTAGARAAEARFAALEVRSYESEYVNALWHLDFHQGSIPVLTKPGEWLRPQLLGVLDDHSRMCCHLQWYLAETAENLTHGLSQAMQKCGLPRALMTDNGGAMTADETTQGLARLGVLHEKTLPYSAYQNGKQESFWGQIEGRLLPMLGGCPDLTLAQLNQATQAWVEMEYNRKVHSATARSPVDRFVNVKDVGRACPSAEVLRQAFTAGCSRTQRFSDGTISIDGVRFEVPSRYRHIKRIGVRYAAWDLSYVHLADARSDQILTRLFPQDKHKNADGHRRQKETIGDHPDPTSPPPRSTGMAPLLRKFIADYAATGLPPAYLPKDELKIQE